MERSERDGMTNARKISLRSTVKSCALKSSALANVDSPSGYVGHVTGEHGRVWQRKGEIYRAAPKINRGSREFPVTRSRRWKRPTGAMLLDYFIISQQNLR